MTFETPMLWLLLPVLAALVWMLARRSYAQLEPWAKRFSLVVRLLIVILLLAAIARPELYISSDRSHAVFLLDVSRSITKENLDAAIEQIDRLAREHTARSGKQLVSVVAFGSEPTLLLEPQSAWNGLSESILEKLHYRESLEQLQGRQTNLISSNEPGDELEEIRKRIEEIETFQDEIVGEETNLERAVRLALNVGPSDSHRALYVFTDGHFTRGDWRAAIRTPDEEPRFRLVLLDISGPAEVAAVDLHLPPSVRTNEGFTGELRIASSVETEADLVIYSDGFAIDERHISIAKGETRLDIPGLYFREKGFHVIEAVIRPRDDKEIRNNTVRALTVVPGEARILYVDSEETMIPYLQSALELEGMQVEARPASGVPQSLSELLSFDAFILSNVPADRMTRRQMQMIKSYIEDFGGGFIMLGGDESFGLGGYFDTPIEEVLPVHMPIQKDLMRPSLALMLVIDKSGSMDGVKIQLAKRAAIASAEAINPVDLIGVIGFDGGAHVVLELTSAGDRGAITSRIGSLSAGGGTFLYPALQEAHRRLSETNARRKHIIVLSDGQTQGFGYEGYVQQIAGDGITLSSVGIGAGADMQLMEGIALAGAGRAYFTNDFQSIPQIFTREALRASKNMLVEGLIAPIAIEEDPSLQEINAQDLPLITGYVATTPKAASDVSIVSDTGDPILARWRYGLGRTAAFTSDTKPRWAEDWIEWPDFAKFWSQLIRSLAGADLAEDLSVEITHERNLESENTVLLTLDVRDSEGNFRDDVEIDLAAMSANPDRRILPVHRTGPGRFSATTAEVIYGDEQQFAFQIRRPGRDPLTVPYGFVYSTSPEFQTLGPNEAIIEQVSDHPSVVVSRIGDNGQLFDTVQTERRVGLWRTLLIIALLLTPLDILVRRLG